MLRWRDAGATDRRERDGDACRDTRLRRGGAGGLVGAHAQPDLHHVAIRVAIPSWRLIHRGMNGHPDVGARGRVEQGAGALIGGARRRPYCTKRALSNIRFTAA